jgi:hypothetical protein
MSCLRYIAICMLFAGCGAEVRGQAGQRASSLGYVYPAGGQQGTTFTVLAGGQALRGAKFAHITGDGVKAEVLDYYPPLRNLDGDQRKLLQWRLGTLIQQRWEEEAAAGRFPPMPPDLSQSLRFLRGGKRGAPDDVELPNHFLINDLESRTLRELLDVATQMRDYRKKQVNNQIGETVLLKVSIAKDAPPGTRELRVGAQVGLSNPLYFQVGVLAEQFEQEPNDPHTVEYIPLAEPVELPVQINGQIQPGDVDRIRFRAEAGTQLIIEAQARQLVPFLADAVPGWFQAVLSLYDDQGRELAVVDDYRSSPDPVMLFEVPETGVYSIDIRDSIYRGREDFVYRLSLSTEPFITSMFPLGGRTGQDRYAQVVGWNLLSRKLRLEMDGPAGEVHKTAWSRGARLSNTMAYDVDALPGKPEKEPNDQPDEAQSITVPRVVDGRIDAPGDVDLFEFKGRAGEEVIVEVVARRLGSPVDSVVRLLAEDGAVVAWNDDYEHKEGFLHTEMGLETHHADSYVRAALPEKGKYSVQIRDALGAGGDEYAYRLRVGRPQPDFALRVVPSSITVPPGRSALLHVHVLRRDGFAGPIEVQLNDAPQGVSLEGAVVPAERDYIKMTLSAPRKGPKQPFTLQLIGRAEIDGKPVTHAAVPADNRMQAFLYRHLVPAQEQVVWITGRWLGRSLGRVGSGSLRMTPGSQMPIRFRIPQHPRLKSVELELVDPPAGVSIVDVHTEKDGQSLLVAVDASVVPANLVDNLIIEAIGELQRGDGKNGRTTRVSLGVLPAIPLEVVESK